MYDVFDYQDFAVVSTSEAKQAIKFAMTHIEYGLKNPIALFCFWILCNRILWLPLKHLLFIITVCHIADRMAVQAKNLERVTEYTQVVGKCCDPGRRLLCPE